MSAAVATTRCPHCGAAVEGPDGTFCCPGCELASAIIRDAGLERYYAEREAFAPRPDGLAASWSTVPVEQRADGRSAAKLVVDGLRCASCTWLVERVLERTPGVSEATVSYATGRALLVWDPAQAELDAICRRIASLGYRPRALGEAAAPDRDLLVRLGVAVFAAMNVMMLSAALYAGWLDAMAPRHQALIQWASLALATPVAVWSAAPFFDAALTGLRHRVLHVDLPISLAVALLYGHAVFATLTGADTYLDSMTMLVALLLAGRMLEARGRRRTSEAAAALAATLPRAARRVVGDRVETVAAGSLAAGDRVEVGAGEEIAADGVIEQGGGRVRMALITGESEPVPVAAGASVVAGAVLVEGSLRLRVTASGDESRVHQMADALRLAADRAVQPTLADRLAPWFTGLTLSVAALAFTGWSLAAGTDRALEVTVAVLVVACPCALALAHPLSAAAGLGAAARRGLLLGSGDALLALAEADHAVLDKTGTLTGGEPVVVEASDAVLRLAAGLERYSAHPIARGIVAEAIRREIPLPHGMDVVEEPGVGVRGVVDGRRLRLQAGAAGEVALSDEDGPVGRIRLADTLRGDAERTVAALRALGLRTVLLSGDHPDVAAQIGATAGVDEVRGAVGPEAKAAFLREGRAKGQRLLFAGDGLNDGPALAAADVGVAMGTGAASSVLAADGVVPGDGIAPLAAGIRAARAARRAIRLSVARSIAYNVLAVAAATAGLVNPLVAAVLMPLSSGMVMWQATRIERAVAREEG